MINENIKNTVKGGVIGATIASLLMSYPIYSERSANHQLSLQNNQLKTNINKYQTEVNNLENKVDEMSKQISDLSSYIKSREKLYKEAEQLKAKNDKLKEENTILRQYRKIKGSTASRGMGSIEITNLKVKKVKVEISMYSRQEFNNNTASGKRPRFGMVAAPKEIPFGTDFIIPGFNNVVFTVEDRGGYIKKVGDVYRIDIFVETTEEAIKFGRQTRYAYMIMEK
ncbi:MAG: hypothetical protein N2749_00945 [Clostridia bacterium]|nr:hypothetical protein [Clostridia bacterium]